MKTLITVLVFAVLIILAVKLTEPKQPQAKINPVSVNSIDPHLISPSDLDDPYGDKVLALSHFFHKYNCPSVNYDLIDSYLNASDTFSIDYRLLPSISIAESSCGQHACKSNFWGWNSCQGDSFTDPIDGIFFITGKLAGGDYYRDKTIDEKLRAYNPNPAYAGKVEQLMKEINE